MHNDSSHFRYSTGYVFNAKFSLDNFDFSSDFYALEFLGFAWSKSLSKSQFLNSWTQLVAI